MILECKKEAPKKQLGFYVLNTRGGIPVKIHETYESAKKEAIRLAEKGEGGVFSVLEIKAVIRIPAPKIEIIEY